MEDVDSTDLRIAKETCEYFHIKHVSIPLPRDINELKGDILLLRNKFGVSKKTEFECLWPFLHTFPLVEEDCIVSGLESDKHFGLSKKDRIHFIQTVEIFDAHKREAFSKLTQHHIQKQMTDETIIFPFIEPDMLDRLCGHTWDELNKPKEKMPVRMLFTPQEREDLTLNKHTNLQLGDSGIAKHFEVLLDSDWNLRNYKSVVGVYNSVVNKEVGQ
jgi:hypothetical protein